MRRGVASFLSIYLLHKPFCKFIVSAIAVFVFAAALQHDLVVAVAFDTPHKTASRIDAFAELAFFRWNVCVSRFIRKIADKCAPALAVILIISYSEKLPTAENSKVENDIIRCAAIDICVLWVY